MDQESTTTEPVLQAPPADTPDVTVEPVQDREPAQPTFDADYVAKLRAENAKYRTAAKQNAEKASRLDEIEEAQKSESEKLQAKLDAAERRAAEAEQARLRAEIAQSKGVPADLLSGATEDELTASAERLLAFRGQQSEAADYGRTAAPTITKPKQLTKADMASMSTADIVKADEAGLFDDLKAGRK